MAGMARRRAISLSVAALGISSMVTQIVLLRESLSILSGNEVMLGVYLACWLLLTAAGSYLGKLIKAGVRTLPGR